MTLKETDLLNKDGLKQVQGTGSVLEGTENVTIIAAQGAKTVIRIISGYVTVSLAATGGTGEVALEDGSGGTRFFQADADAVGHFPFDFGPRGYALSVNTLLNITVDGAGTNEATATCTVVGYVTDSTG